MALISNKVKLSHSGLNTALAIDLTPPIRMRQTIRIGDDCAGVLECTGNSVSTVIKCTTPIFGLQVSGSGGGRAPFGKMLRWISEVPEEIAEHCR
jgi:hypothetical protein